MMSFRNPLVVLCFLSIFSLIGCADTRLLYRMDNGTHAGNRFGVTNEGGGTRIYGSFGHGISWQHDGR